MFEFTREEANEKCKERNLAVCFNTDNKLTLSYRYQFDICTSIDSSATLIENLKKIRVKDSEFRDCFKIEKYNGLPKDFYYANIYKFHNYKLLSSDEIIKDLIKPLCLDDNSKNKIDDNQLENLQDYINIIN